MGNGRLLIGTNLGDATVYNPNPGIQQFGQLIAQQKADQDKKDQMLINQMSQLKPDQLRTDDREDYLNKYNDWKNTAIQANNLPRNSRGRLDALAAAQSKYSDLNTFIGQSKREQEAEHQLAQTRLLHPHLFEDDVDEKLTKSLRSPMSSPDFIPQTSYPTLQRYVDDDKANEGFDKAYKAKLGEQSWSNPIQSPNTQGDKKGTLIHSERAISPTDVLSTAAHLYDLDKNTRASIDKRYANIQGANDGETKMLRLRQNAIDRGDVVLNPDGSLTNGEKTIERSKPEFKSNYKPDPYYDHYNFRMDNPTNPIPYSAPTPHTIPFAGGKGNVVTAPNYVPLSLPNKNFAGAAGINMTTGKPEAGLNSSDDYSIVGAGDFPVIKQGLNGAGTLVQPNFAAQHPNAIEYKRMVHVKQKPDPTLNIDATDHLIPYENLPKNVSGQKDVRSALKGLDDTPVYGTPTPNAATKSGTPLVNKHKKAASDYGL